MIGHTLAHFDILEKLGEGGMGVVYKARDKHLDRLVAIKILPPDQIANPDRRLRLVQEAKTASALNHPGIVAIHDIAHDKGVDFIAMEFVPGRTLERVIPRRGLGLTETVDYGIQIADALAAAHAAGIVHRDLKPSNVIVTEQGRVRVLDFGLAKLFDRAGLAGADDGPTATHTGLLTAEGVIAGTVVYMSPEQAQGKSVDARTDIFSFGSLLYEMVTGQRAFQGDSPLSTMTAVVHEEPKPVSQMREGVPRELERIITRCLRKDSVRRWQVISDISIALRELKEEVESAVPTGTTTATSGRRRALMAVATIWRMSARGANPVQVTQRGGTYAKESIDRRYIDYGRSGPVTGLWRVPVAGGEEVEVVPRLASYANFAVASAGLYFEARLPGNPLGHTPDFAPFTRLQAAIDFFSFATGKVSRVITLDRPAGHGLDLSADERTLLFAQMDGFTEDLMLVENLR